jgi:hypothetical protein
MDSCLPRRCSSNSWVWVFILSNEVIMRPSMIPVRPERKLPWRRSDGGLAREVDRVL